MSDAWELKKFIRMLIYLQEQYGLKETVNFKTQQLDNFTAWREINGS